MNNYSLYCEKCDEFFPTATTSFKLKEDILNDQVWWHLCPKCGEPIHLSCNWHLTINHNYSRGFVRQRCVGLDRLEKMCYNCDNKFKCWTGEL